MRLLSFGLMCLLLFVTVAPKSESGGGEGGNWGYRKRGAVTGRAAPAFVAGVGYLLRAPEPSGRYCRPALPGVKLLFGAHPAAAHRRES